MIVLEDKDVTVKLNRYPYTVDNANVVEFDSTQSIYYSRKIPSRYAWKEVHGEITVYHLNCKGSFTAMEDQMWSKELLRYLGKNV